MTNCRLECLNFCHCAVKFAYATIWWAWLNFHLSCYVLIQRHVPFITRVLCLVCTASIIDVVYPHNFRRAMYIFWHVAHVQHTFGYLPKHSNVYASLESLNIFKFMRLLSHSLHTHTWKFKTFGSTLAFLSWSRATSRCSCKTIRSVISWLAVVLTEQPQTPSIFPYLPFFLCNQCVPSPIYRGMTA